MHASSDVSHCQPSPVHNTGTITAQGIFAALLAVCCIAFFAWPSHASAPAFNKYTSSSGPLIITHSATMPPLSFLDNKGMPAGFIVELWKEWSRVTGIPVRFKLTTWENSLALVEQGKAHIHGGLFLTPERSERLMFGEPYFNTKGAIFVRNDVQAATPADLGHVPVGVLRSGYGEHYLKTRYPEIQRLPQSTMTELVHKAVAGNLVALQGDYETVNHLLCAKQARDRFTVLKVLYDRHMYYAVRYGSTDLLETVADGLALIDYSTRSSIFHKTVEGNTTLATLNNTSGSVMLLTVIFCAAMYWTLMQRQQIQLLKQVVKESNTARSAALTVYESATAELQHFRSIVDRMPDMDPLTGLPNRNYLHQRLTDAWRNSISHGRPVSLVVIDAAPAFSSLANSDARDMSIKIFAETLSSCPLRREDTLVRFDTTIFACLLPDTDERGAMLVRDTVHIAAQDFSKRLLSGYDTTKLPLTGYACADPYTGDTPAALIEEALSAMRHENFPHTPPSIHTP